MMTQQQSWFVVAKNSPLDERQKRVMRLRFGLAGNRRHLLKEIADMEGITYQAVQAIIERAFGRIKKEMRNSTERPV